MHTLTYNIVHCTCVSIVHSLSFSPSLSSFPLSVSLSLSPPQIALLQQYPQLKQYIRPAVEKAVQDLLVPVAERSIKIALTTTEHIIRKVLCISVQIVMWLYILHLM